MWNDSTGACASRRERLAATGIFIAGAAATLTVSVRSPLAAWAYALVVLAGACWWNCDFRYFVDAERSTPARVILRESAMIFVAGAGAIQWITGKTVYRYATLDASTRAIALIAATFVVRGALRSEALRRRFLGAFVWFATVVSGVSVLTFFTSPGRILWIFPSPYPDTWGPFLSRNDFAAFLELALPVALWLALGDRRAGRVQGGGRPLTAARDSPSRFREAVTGTWPRASMALYLGIAAWILAAGVASASRAGSALLAFEAVIILGWKARLGPAVKFASAAVVFVALVGAGTLFGRWRAPDAWRYRREIDRSAIAMIATRPLGGFGLGTFARVYPAYALFDAGAVVEHAHNDWLEWTAEGGLPYGLAWVAIALTVVKPATRSIWGLGVIAIFLHALVDYPFARFGVSAWTMALIGALGADEMRKVPAGIH